MNKANRATGNSLRVIRQDITKLDVDAIVNAANPELREGDGVCGAIFHAAGAENMTRACEQIGPIQPGDAVVTPGFDLPAKIVIHTAGPIYYDGRHGEPQILRACYMESLYSALDNDCRSVAFPLISTGIFGFPPDEAAMIAVTAIKDFLLHHDLDVILVVWDDRSTDAVEMVLGQKAVRLVSDDEVAQWVAKGRHPFEVQTVKQYREERMAQAAAAQAARGAVSPLDLIVSEPQETFSQKLFSLIKDRNFDEDAVFKRAALSRNVRYNLRNNRPPSRETALALAVALELNKVEADDLLRRAGLAFSAIDKRDIIVEYFINDRRYDGSEIDSELNRYGLPPLFAAP